MISRRFGPGFLGLFLLAASPAIATATPPVQVPSPVRERPSPSAPATVIRGGQKFAYDAQTHGFKPAKPKLGEVLTDGAERFVAANFKMHTDIDGQVHWGIRYVRLPYAHSEGNHVGEGVFTEWARDNYPGRVVVERRIDEHLGDYRRTWVLGGDGQWYRLDGAPVPPPSLAERVKAFVTRARTSDAPTKADQARAEAAIVYEKNATAAQPQAGPRVLMGAVRGDDGELKMVPLETGSRAYDKQAQLIAKSNGKSYALVSPSGKIVFDGAL
jgi:hypothetical protein